MHYELKNDENHSNNFTNNDAVLKLEAQKIEISRKELGLIGLVGDLQSIIINVEMDKVEATVNEFLSYTNYKFHQGFINGAGRKIVLKCKGSADIIIKSEASSTNLFVEYNDNLKSKHLPNTRLEAFVFNCFDIHKYFRIQKQRGAIFVTEEIVETDNYYFIQTIPSSFTGNSIGLIQWKRSEGEYKSSKDEVLEIQYTKQGKIYLNNIGKLDHAATRVKAEHRDAALIEFMELTNYSFDFAIYINSLNSITNVARLEGAKFAAVFTSGIKPFIDEYSSGPTEKFIHNYGIRVHHLAFETEDIDYTYSELKKNGCNFLSEVVGSEGKGIKQVFSEPSPNTLIVNEYVSRYGGFSGFFIEENVSLLTKATENQ
jgi:4-hydroxyphenylpyruvate dioxygenase-like putative hemolysin